MDVVEDDRQARVAQDGQVWENIATYNGDLWAEWNPYDRRLQVPRKKAHRTRIPVNLSKPIVRTELSKLTKNRPIIDVLAGGDDKKDLDAAEVGDKILNKWVEKNYHMPKVRRRALKWVLVGGLGGIFVDFDESLDPIYKLVDADGLPVEDPQQHEMWRQYWAQKKKSPIQQIGAKGDLVIEPLSYFEFGWDRSKEAIEDAKYCYVSQVYDVTEVERRWNEQVERDEDSLPGVLERRQLARFDRTSRLSMKAPKSQDLCTVHRIFVKPGHLYFPNGQEIVFTKDKLIEARDFPFSHGQLPVSSMGHIPSLGTQFPTSTLQDVRGPVLELSKTVSQMVDNRNLMANPPWRVADQHNIDEAEIQNKPGARIKYRHAPNIPPPEPLQMPELPGYVQAMPELMRDFLLQISGQGETTQGRVPPGARSGVAIAYLQEEDDTRLGTTVQEFEEMNERVAWQILQVIAEKFDIPRTVTISKRRHAAPEVMNFKGDLLAGIGGVEVQAGSALPRSKAAKQQFMLDLWDRGIEKDPRRVRFMLELAEGEPDEYEIDMDHADRENEFMQRGEQRDVLDWHNHEAHLFMHRRWMKSADFDEAEDHIKDIFERHVSEHEQEVQNAQQKAYMDQLMSSQMAGTNGTGGPPSMPGTGGPPGANGGGVPTPQGPFDTAGPADLMDETPQ